MSGISNTERQNPAFYADQFGLSTDYVKMADMLGAPAVLKGKKFKQPVTFRVAEDLWNKTTSSENAERIKAFIMRWYESGDASWFAKVAEIVQADSPERIIETEVEFDAEIPAILSDLVPVPIIHHTEKTTTHTYTMHGLGQAIAWSTLVTERGRIRFRKGQTTIASCIILHIRLNTHGAIWREQIEASYYATVSRIPYLADLIADRYNTTGAYDPGVLHHNENGWSLLCGAVRFTMNKFKSGFKMIVLKDEMQFLLSYGPSRNMEPWRNPAVAGKIDQQAEKSVSTGLGIDINWEGSYSFRGRGRNGGHYDAMIMDLTLGARFDSDNSYVQSFSETNFNVETSSGNAVLPPSTSKMRDIHYLDLFDRVRYKRIPTVEWLRSLFCYDQDHPLLPIRRDFYDHLAESVGDYLKDYNLGELPEGARDGEKVVDPNLYTDRDGNLRTVELLGQTSHAVDGDFVDSAARVARQRMVAALGAGNMSSLDVLADFSRGSVAGLQVPISANPSEWSYEAFSWASVVHAPNKPDEGSYDIQYGPFGVGHLPDLVSAADTEYSAIHGAITVNDAAGRKLLVVARRRQLSAEDIGRGMRPEFEVIPILRGAEAMAAELAELHFFVAPKSGIPPGFSSINHIKTFINAADLGEIPGWVAWYDRSKSGKRINRLREALKAWKKIAPYLADATAFGVDPVYEEDYGNFGLSTRSLPPFLRVPEDDSVYPANEARRLNMECALFEGPVMMRVSDPTYVLATIGERDVRIAARKGTTAITRDEARSYLRKHDTFDASIITQEAIEGMRYVAGVILAGNVTTELLEDYRYGFRTLTKDWNAAAEAERIGSDLTEQQEFDKFLKFKLEEIADSGDEDDKQKSAEEFVNALEGLIEMFDEASSGGDIPVINQSYITELGVKFSSKGVERVRGGRAFEEFEDRSFSAAKNSEEAQVLYYCNKLCMPIKYWLPLTSSRNRRAASSSITRPGNPHVAGLRPLAPLANAGREANIDENMLSELVSGIELGHSNSGKDIFGVYENFQGFSDEMSRLSIGSGQRKPKARGNRRLQSEEYDLSYDEYRMEQLPSFMGTEALKLISDSPDLIARLKRVSRIEDLATRMLSVLFLLQPNYGLKQIQFAQRDWLVWKTGYAVFPFCKFKTFAAYFLNPSIITHKYFLHDSAIIVDGEHWKITVQERYMIASYVKQRNTTFVAPHTAFQSFCGGTNSIANTKFEYGQANNHDEYGRFVNKRKTSKSSVHFNIASPGHRHGDMFVLDGGAIQYSDTLSAVTCLSPRNLSSSTAGRNAAKMSPFDTMLPSGLAFAIMSGFGNLATRGRPSFTNFKSMQGDYLNDICWRAPQKMPNIDSPGYHVRSGEGYWKNFMEGIGDSLAGKPVLFSNCNGPAMGTLNVRDISVKA